MSGFAYNLKLTTAITPVAQLTYDDEAAGKIGKIFGVIAAVVMPFAAPAIWGALAGSTGILSGLGGALTGAFGAGAANIIGSAAVGALGNAAVAYAGGARGGDVWRAAGMGAVSGGLGAFSQGLTSRLGAQVAAPTTTAAGPVALAPSAAATAAGAPANIAIGATVANGAATGGAGTGIIQSIMSRFGSDPQLVSRLGAAVVNAAVNGGTVRGMEDLVVQQRAELQALQAKGDAAYAQRTEIAKTVLDLANRSDPDWLGRIRMADVKGMETNQYRQTMRDIATQQGGTLSWGQRRATQRNLGLKIARDTALAYNQGHDEGVNRQAQLYGQAAGLFTDPNFQPWEADTNLRLGLQNTRTQANRSTAGVFSDALFGHPTYQQPTSPENNTDNTDPFTQGQNYPWTWG